MSAAMDSTAFNMVMNQIGGIMNALGRTPLTDHATRDVFSVLDVAGYNYGRVRMAKYLRRYPDRFMLQTESMPATFGPSSRARARWATSPGRPGTTWAKPAWELGSPASG